MVVGFLEKTRNRSEPTNWILKILLGQFYPVIAKDVYSWTILSTIFKSALLILVPEGPKKEP